MPPAMLRLVLACLIAILLTPSAASAAVRHMQVALTAESATPRPGSEIGIAVTMTPQPGWHGYWLNTGDAGTPDRIRWSLPDGASISALAYPVPERLVVAGLMNYVYAHPYALLGRLKIPEDMAAGAPLRLGATIDYLVCSDTLCVPERANVALALTAGNGAIAPASRARFDTWRAALPRPLGQPADFAVRNANRLALAVPLAGVEQVRSAYFYPAANDVLDHAAPQRAGISGNSLIVELPRKSGRTAPAALDGVLSIERAGGSVGLAISAVPGPVAEPESWLTADGSLPLASFGLTMILAIAGGLILNAMPCVFPILSLKALSLARSGESSAAARTEAIAYSGGVIATCLGLGAVILLLRAGGENVGWAFQLQNPHVTLGLLLLVTAIALNLAGLFDLPSLSLDHPGAPTNKPSGAFLTGALAAFVATPCTGPFMGAALGSALVLPPVAALGIFAGLGLGIALPFLALAYIPALRTRLPRPGPWMETFRRILAVPMVLTAIGLGWVLGRQAGTPGMTLGIAAATAAGLALWWHGRRQGRGRRGGVAFVFLIAACIVPLVLIGRMAPAPATSARLGGNAFSEARLQQLRQQGKPVFVYFTADWCLTCKVNEQAAIDREPVRTAFTRAGVGVLVGDWTNGDPAITRFLETHGRSGVPLYLFYPKGGGAPRVLPQLLTVSTLTALAS